MRVLPLTKYKEGKKVSRYGGLSVLFISEFVFSILCSILIFSFINNAYFLFIFFREQDTVIVVESERKKVIDLRRVLFLPTNM